jgi:DNA-binding Lrp family transcriptional regulator
MQTTDLQLSELERDFINHYQGNFPLQERPFLTIAKRFDCSEDELITTVKQLKEKNILTRFGPLYDAAKLGGGLTLAAMSIPVENYDDITELVNSYPEVAHNYRREHELNMWFVLATELPAQIIEVIHSIEQKCGLPVYNFPKQQEFYIGLWLHLSADGNNTTVPVPTITKQVTDDQTAEDQIDNHLLDDIDRKLINVTQTGLAITQEPYKEVAEKIGRSQEQVLFRLNRLLNCDIIRRIGAVPNHYKLGFTANGMSVWNVEDSMIDELGSRIGQLDFVSHCYQRPRNLPAWPYNLFAMVHGSSRDEVNQKVKEIENILGRNCSAYDTLYSSKILKKTGLRLGDKGRSDKNRSNKTLAA